jgi:superfamily II DNA or RNA helicase
MSRLRDYQERAAAAIEAQWKTHTSTLCVLPTGAGKTVLFAEVIRRRLPGRTLVLAHREELIYQAREKIERFAGLDCEVEMADQVAAQNLWTRDPVVIGTVQTLRHPRRLLRFRPEDFSTIVIDESHHSTATSYRVILEHFLRNPELKVLGVTATPDRADAEALGQVFESVAFDYQLVQAIEDGWLCPVEQQMVTIAGLDFSRVRTTAGDLNGADLAAVMEAEMAMQGVCSATLEIIGRRQAILFAATVRQAEMACAIFNRHRRKIADWVCGATEKEARRATMKAVLEGRTQILCNVGVATEGFDAPGVEVIIMARPTKSRALYAQMAGRATRPLPGVVDGPACAEARRSAIAESAKPSCLLVDFCGNSGRHKLITGLDLLGGNYSDEARELAQRKLQESGTARGIARSLEESDAELEEERRRQQLAEMEARRLEREARRARLVARATFSRRAVDPFDRYEVSAGRGPRAHDVRVLSEKQRASLRKNHLDPDSMSYSDAKKALDEIFHRMKEGLCSSRQVALLGRYGYDATAMTRPEASQLIGAIAANGWKRLVPHG